MKLNWNFLGGGGYKPKIFHGGVWIFPGAGQFPYPFFLFLFKGKSGLSENGVSDSYTDHP